MLNMLIPTLPVTVMRFIFLILPLTCFILLLSHHSQAQDANKAIEECQKVLQKAAKKSGKSYAKNACSSNVYPASFWQCVDKELEVFDLNIAVNFCEKSYGFK